MSERPPSAPTSLDDVLKDNPHTAVLTHPQDARIRAQFVLVTPELATMILRNKPGWQRKVSETTVERYSVDMANDEFAFNGASVCLDDKGHLIDGQHRLHAIAQTRKPLVMLLVFGLRSEAIGAIDTGRKRRFADWLAMNGHKEQSSVVSGMVVRRWHWEHGNYAKKGQPRVHRAQFTNATPSTAQLASTWQAVQDQGVDWVAAAQCGWRAHAATKTSPGVWGFAYILFSEIDPYQREEFFTKLVHGVKDDGSNDHPINLLRGTLLRRADENLSDVTQLHMIFTAWTAYQQGRTLGSLRKPIAPVMPDSLAVPLGWEPRGEEGPA